MAERTPDEKRLFEDDPFWDIDTLMPKGAKTKKNARRAQSGASPQGPLPAAGGKGQKDDARQSGEEGSSASRGTQIPAFSEKPEKTFTYDDDRLIKSVEIYTWPNRYTFFDGFRRNALAIFHMRGAEVPFEPFFSFMPQYHQLTAAQLRYYLFWRESFQEGVSLRTDYCYLLLYICEILNLPDALPPKRGAELLCRLWISYRKAFPKLDKYLAEWLCDYCLVNDVRPSERLFELVCDAGRANCTFREFYMTREQCAVPSMLLSSYSYKNSKYRTPENAGIFDKHIPAALAEFFRLLSRREKEGRGEGTVRISRTSYDGAVCVYSEKKRIDVFYTPAKTVGTATLATDAEKLCENYVRSYFGIRARMPSPSLDGEMRRVIEEYFARNLPSSSTAKKTEELRINDRYEPEDHGFSASEAAEIERSSRLIAERLGQVYEDDASASGANGLKPEKEQPAHEGAETENENEMKSETHDDAQDAYGEQHRQALLALITGGSSAFAAYAKSIGVQPHSLADEINEEAIERIGDIVLVGDDSGFEILPDYEKEVEEWINSSN